MYCYYMKKFEDFDIFLACNNRLVLLKEVEKKYLVPSKVIDICQERKKCSVIKVTGSLLVYKHKFEDEYIDVWARGYWYKCMSN